MTSIKTPLYSLIVLPCLLGAALSLAQAPRSEVQQQGDSSIQGNPSEQSALEQITSPNLVRREISQAQLDNENWEVGLYGGVLSIEDFGSNSVTGVRLAYHLTEDFAVEFTYGQSETSDEVYRELIGDFIFVLTDTEFTYYNASLVYNLFQGEVFLGRNTAFNNGFYLLIGGGNTTFNDNDYFTLNFGGGMRFYATDWAALHFTVKNHMFNNDITDKTTNNLEATLGLSVYF